MEVMVILPRRVANPMGAMASVPLALKEALAPRAILDRRERSTRGHPPSLFFVGSPPHPSPPLLSIPPSIHPFVTKLNFPRTRMSRVGEIGGVCYLSCPSLPLTSGRSSKRARRVMLRNGQRSFLLAAGYVAVGTRGIGWASSRHALARAGGPAAAALPPTPPHGLASLCLTRVGSFTTSAGRTRKHVPERKEEERASKEKEVKEKEEGRDAPARRSSSGMPRSSLPAVRRKGSMTMLFEEWKQGHATGMAPLPPLSDTASSSLAIADPPKEKKKKSKMMKEKASTITRNGMIEATSTSTSKLSEPDQANAKQNEKESGQRMGPAQLARERNSSENVGVGEMVAQAARVLKLERRDDRTKQQLSEIVTQLKSNWFHTAADLVHLSHEGARCLASQDIGFPTIPDLPLISFGPC